MSTYERQTAQVECYAKSYPDNAKGPQTQQVRMRAYVSGRIDGKGGPLLDHSFFSGEI